MKPARANYLNDLVFLSLVDFPGEAAARQSVVDDEFVGLEARFFEKFGTCAEKPYLTCVHGRSSVPHMGRGKTTHLCILEQVRFHWNQSPILYLRWDWPVCSVSHTRVNLDDWKGKKKRLNTIP